MANEWNLGEKKRAIVKEVEKAILVSVRTAQQTEAQSQEYLDELEFLALTAGAVTVKRFRQALHRPDKRTYVGKGKAEEILDYVEANEEVNLIIFDDDLTGKQTNILEEMMCCKILDRSSLILDIFANRAQTAQAKTQVELAQMQYLLPRLRGLWTHLERQRGGIGMRGPGEKEIETDRRIVRDKISLLKGRLKKIDEQAKTQRKNRTGMIRVALVGYTNVGKSTIMNVFGKADVFAENKLFATLDTTVRKVVIDRMPFLLSDTVGFIRKLPHHLVESFKSTLDEVRESDLLVHVVDVSHPHHLDHMRVVQRTLKDLGVADKPQLLVFNKMDLFREANFDEFIAEEEKAGLEEEFKTKYLEENKGQVVFLSAVHKEGIEEFSLGLKDLIQDLYLERYPHRNNFW